MPQPQKIARPLFRSGLTLALLALIIADLAMIAAAVGRYPAFFLQPGARAFVMEAISALIAYAIAIIFIARTHGIYWDTILRNGAIFGVLAGGFEAINIGIENGIPFAIRGPILQICFMLVVFTAWGIAGFRTTNDLRSVRAGLLASVCSAAICMVIAVTAGFMIEFFVAPTAPEYVATWGEFMRSGWTDARAFGLANTLDSGFTHLLAAPVVALLLGGIASSIARFRLSKVYPVTP